MSSNTDQAALLEAIELQDAFPAKTQFAKFLLKQEVQQEARRLFRECSEKTVMSKPKQFESQKRTRRLNLFFSQPESRGRDSFKGGGRFVTSQNLAFKNLLIS